jgi:DNA helicase-2/ATP-dependent DNA helicase PcrA
VFLHYKEFPDLEVLSAEGRATIEKIVGDVEAYLKLARENPTGVVLYEFFTESGYLKRLTKQETERGDQKIQNIAKFFEIVKSFGEVAQIDRVAYFVPYLDLLMEAGDDPATAEVDLDADAVHVLTVHKAKGLEFPVVFIIGVEEGLLPHKNAIEHGTVDEERRLFYVGLTRAKKKLFLFYTTERKLYGISSSPEPSCHTCHRDGLLFQKG